MKASDSSPVISCLTSNGSDRRKATLSGFGVRLSADIFAPGENFKERKINKFRAACRAHGLSVPRIAVHNTDIRREWISNLPQALAVQLSIMTVGLDAAIEQSDIARKLMIKRSKPYKMISYWNQLPGMGPIRSAILFAYLDTPWRFFNPKKFWKYCGVGLKNTSSGTNRYDKPNTPRLCLYRNANRRLKAITLGAVLSAVRRGQ